MIYITQLIYIKEGQEKMFHEFEDVAIPIIAKYNGKTFVAGQAAGRCFYRK